ncbi:hypothetical protein SRABI118_00322 [Massilia sp. Bi118]|uniref:lanthionine synthetase C family protein n=1 Tax=Massilia sp. Bi118 TaxID=2822346 RepID=UPI001DAA59B9|nr:LanC-like protein [Massilia sp. Bi118]CAH0142548.1 hypothetical protein SRABI118_00322 [Massilia sp. Bi118]
MLYDPTRHEALDPRPWDEARARAAIADIVAGTEARFDAGSYWPLHPLDREGDGPDMVETPLYHGAAGVVWALHYLQDCGAVRLSRDYLAGVGHLLAANRGWLDAQGLAGERASWLMGDTPILMMALAREPGDTRHTQALHERIAGNIEHPARELMWGAPGTLLAALFLHERSGDPSWAALFRATADTLWRQLAWSEEHGCAYWTQELYGRRSSYLDAVHGFIAAAVPLIRGRHLLDDDRWEEWRRCIASTVRRTADLEGTQANWRPQLFGTQREADKKLLQFCHGAPGFVICLAGFPGEELDDLLLAAGETVWAAGPLAKGSNLCHGTGGNGYALLVLYQRTGDPRWLERARAFAMHGIHQVERDAAHYGQGRYSLWTGDPGFAIYLWDCLRAEADFPTLDVFQR